MKISLIIAEFEIYYCTSFQNTARVKYEIDFDTSNVDDLEIKLNELKYKIENNIHLNKHVGFQITLEHVIHVQELLDKIINHYIELFGQLPINRKIYTIIQRIRDAETPTPKELAKEVLAEILTPKTKNLSKAEKLKIDAEAKSKERLLKMLQKNNTNNK